MFEYRRSLANRLNVLYYRISELVIPGGSQTPLEGDFAFSVEDIQKALVERKERLAALKEKGTAKKAPAPASGRTTSALDVNDLGF